VDPVRDKTPIAAQMWCPVLYAATSYQATHRAGREMPKALAKAMDV
jgi:hypothetical protein